MPPSTNVKRVKNTRVERAFIIGSEAWPLDDSNRKPDTPPDHTKGWRVYVRTPEGQPDITRWLKKVQFKIYHTYQNPTRLAEAPPFQIEETGWGGFNVEIRLFFPPESSLKPEYRTHFLQLETYGDEATQAKQRADKLVRSEFLDYIEFNEPTEAFYETLTSEGQWANKKAPGGRGAGKGKNKKDAVDGAEGTVELPNLSTPTNPYSKQLEQQILDLLGRAEKQVEEEIKATQKEREAIQKELRDVKSGVIKS